MAKSVSTYDRLSIYLRAGLSECVCARGIVGVCVCVCARGIVCGCVCVAQSELLHLALAPLK